MDEFVALYASLSSPLKIVVWVLAIVLLMSLIKRPVKLAILVTILIILMFVARAIYLSVP